MEAALAEEVEAQEEMDAIDRDACLAPAGEEWKLMLRREETLDRSIDRKIKLLLSLRKEAAKLQEPQTSESRSAPPPVKTTALSPRERVSRSGAVISRRVTGEGSMDSPGAGQPSPTEEADGIIPAREEKINERSGNVDENKGRLTATADPRQRSAPAGPQLTDTKLVVTPA